MKICGKISSIGTVSMWVKCPRNDIRQFFCSILGFKLRNGAWFKPCFKHTLAPLEWCVAFPAGFPSDDYMKRVIDIATEIAINENDRCDGQLQIPARKLDRVFALADAAEKAKNA